jgi:glycine/D-amino acid oxidase-like deaminating enzyme
MERSVRVAGLLEVGLPPAEVAALELNPSSTSEMIERRQVPWWAKENLRAVASLAVEEQQLDWSQARFWTNYLPLSADDQPLVGSVRAFENLQLNVGHGAKSWTLALASGELLARQMLGSPKEGTLDRMPFSPARFGL